MDALKALKREEKGYKSRREGFVPGVLYGKEIETTSVKFQKADVENALRIHGERARLRVSLDGKEQLGIVKEVAREIISRDLLHLDIQLVSLDEQLSIDVPFIFLGTEDLIPKGLVLHTYIDEISLTGTVDVIPESIEINVGDKEDGDSITLADLDLPEGITYLEDDDTQIAAVAIPRVEEIEEDEDAEDIDAADVEVIGEDDEGDADVADDGAEVHED